MDLTCSSVGKADDFVWEDAMLNPSSLQNGGCSGGLNLKRFFRSSCSWIVRQLR